VQADSDDVSGAPSCHDAVDAQRRDIGVVVVISFVPVQIDVSYFPPPSVFHVLSLLQLPSASASAATAGRQPAFHFVVE